MAGRVIRALDWGFELGRGDLARAVFFSEGLVGVETFRIDWIWILVQRLNEESDNVSTFQ